MLCLSCFEVKSFRKGDLLAEKLYSVCSPSFLGRKMDSTSRRGTILIPVIIIIAVILIALFVVIPLLTSNNGSAPVVQDVTWQSGGKNVTSISLGQEVETQVTIQAIEQYTDSVVIKVRKDIAYWFDSDYATKTFPVSLASGQTTLLSVTFTPDEASEGNMRGYFVEIDFSGTGSTWIMDGSYPPRLQVAGVQPGSGTPF